MAGKEARRNFSSEDHAFRTMSSKLSCTITCGSSLTSSPPPEENINDGYAAPVDDTLVNFPSSAASCSEELELANRPPKRKRTCIASENCPICSLTVRPHQMEEHYSSEVQKLDNLKKMTKRNSIKTLTPQQKVLKEVQANRAKRESQKNFESTQNIRSRCGLCNFVPQFPEDFEPPYDSPNSKALELLHLVLCAGLTAENASQIIREHYIAFEEDKISAVLSNSIVGSPSTPPHTPPPHTHAADEDDEFVVVDMDDDDESFGSAQFTEHDLCPCESTLADADQVALRAAVLSSSKRSFSESAESPVDEEGVLSEEICDYGDDAPVSCELETDIQSSPESVVIAALKTKIADLEKQVNSCAKCNICLEAYKEPLVSTVCWHVCCKVCWMQTLGEKKLCPQCNKIALPTNLRRIYL